ncbi:signal transduction histidine kinase [Vibrio ichthyoenteri ATCC 700023]|uniref:histidine kinase n=1 Tax=Vibrio ichthyoenteri ATCC 700023 TaxID=870968 RepID=F9RXR2_9VIBR|nr:response regulator [Vibrio ichthyoenteri]EGU47603.1 signal transduction histidine kinase [Vibrio ichthyoenteri ATCC 700023]
MSFRLKTIIGIAIIEVVLLVMLVFSAMRFLSQSNEEQLLQRVKTTSELFAIVVEKPLLNNQISDLENLVNQLLIVEDLAYIRISVDGSNLVFAGDKQWLAAPMTVDSDLSKTHDGVFDTRVPVNNSNAFIDMGFRTDAINLMLKQARQSIITIALVEVILVAFFSYILGNYLTRSLTRLTKAANTLCKDGPGFQLHQHSKDELGDVSRAFDAMSTKLEQSYTALKHARSEAEQACESKGRFLASMSHEIRTPMNGVLGVLNVLEETKLNKDQRKLITTATDSGHFLLSVINDILDFTRMESNTLILDNSPFDFRHCVESVVDSFMPAAKNNDLILHCYIPAQVPAKVRGDENRIKQILHNLIGNAIKFTQQGSVSIKIESRELEDQHVELICSVTDTGIGIKKHALDYLFDEFTMVDQSYSRIHEGAGLGLAICKRLTQMMDGNVTVSSEPEVGSTFTFTIILELSDELIADVKQTPSHAKPLDPNLRILVAEDNRANQLVINSMFSHAGLHLDMVENGRQAVEQVQKYQYDLIFMDISMPEMDGMQACKAIRALDDPSCATIPIIALTAHALTGDKEKFLEVGMNDYLSKPVRLSQLIEKINLFLNCEQHKTIDDEVKIDAEVTQPKAALNQKQAANVKSEEITVNKELVDEQILQQMIQDTSADVLPLLIDHYVEESQQRMETMNNAFIERNAEVIEFESHTLGSSSLALGNHVLSNLARQIERLCLEGQAEKAFEYHQELMELAQQSFDAIIHRKTQGFTQPIE